MTAVRVLQDGWWIIHSLQQDGVLAEPGRLASGVGATPLATLAPRVSEAIRAKGLRPRPLRHDAEQEGPEEPRTLPAGRRSVPRRKRTLPFARLCRWTPWCCNT